jgi:hypothetical protein
MPGQLPAPEEIPALREVVAALVRARRVNGPGPSFLVCICDEAGLPLAESELASYDQVQRFSRDMARLGYGAHPMNLSRAMHDCDVLYRKQESARDIFDSGEEIDTGPAPL